MLALLAVIQTAGAQSRTTYVDYLEKDIPDCGQVRIERDARLDSLIGHLVPDSESGQMKVTGYRIQLYAGNNTRDARAKAQEVEAYMREKYPELPVYTVFKSPRWLCTAGDFQFYEDAYDLLHEIRENTPYKGALILRNQEINVEF